MSVLDLARLASSDLIAAFDFPDAALVNQRIPKKLLIENGAPTATDRKLIQDGIEEFTWVAALKPASIGVPEYRDEQRSYLELAVLLVDLREAAKVTRLAELIHRAIPYPVVLILSDGTELMLSLAHIRWAQKEADKTVLDGEPSMEHLSGEQSSRSDFLQALSLRRQPRTDLYALYQGWLDTLTALQAASITGRFVASGSAEHAAARRAALHRCCEIDGETARLRLAAAKENQMARQVAVNREIKALLAEREQAAANL
ncbi:MAG TPA: DUF4391 domain-containing protein [Rhodocyclaceae bacterium]|nr:DUF4391 domain-containing protein [Rhodocyclaceae bacterium]